MVENLNNAKEELKRVDHLIYVSLKYTRTVDVLINIMIRMIDAYDFKMESLLDYAQKKGLIASKPETPREKGNLLKKTFKEDEKIRDNIDLYFLLRKLVKTSHTKESEYRRHVAMRAFVDGKEEVVNIDNITNYYHFQLDFLNYVREMISQ
jgi:hypothetical protein